MNDIRDQICDQIRYTIHYQIWTLVSKPINTYAYPDINKFILSRTRSQIDSQTWSTIGIHIMNQLEHNL